MYMYVSQDPYGAFVASRKYVHWSATMDYGIGYQTNARQLSEGVTSNTIGAVLKATCFWIGSSRSEFSVGDVILAET